MSASQSQCRHERIGAVLYMEIIGANEVRYGEAAHGQNISSPVSVEDGCSSFSVSSHVLPG